MAGIKETKELVDAMAALAGAVIDQIKDGVQVSDIGELFAKAMTDEALKAKLTAGFVGAVQVPAEVADLSWMEGISLGSHVLSVVRDVAGKLLK